MNLCRMRGPLRGHGLVLRLVFALLLVVAAPRPALASQFADVDDSHWAQSSGVIDRAVAKGIIKGIEVDGAEYFMPDASVTRAQIATMLGRMAGQDFAGEAPANTTGCWDVEDYAWYTAAFNWAKAKGVFNGYDGQMRPNDAISRQELCQVLGNYAAKVYGSPVQGDNDRLLRYPDASSVAAWARANVAYCVERGVIGGASSLNPAGSATRAEAAKMILVFSDGGAEQPSLLKAHYIDVGQGDATFIELPDGRCMLIDAGPTSEGAAVVSYIRSLGYRRIDYAVMTHPDEDHVGGYLSVLDTLEIGQLYAPGCSNNTRTWEKVLDAIDGAGLTVHSAEKLVGQAIASGDGWSATIRSPSTIVENLNNDSVVVDLAYGSSRLLFAGDASAELLDGCVSGHVDVLKLSHHGSSTGTNASLVSRLSPDVAVISCGANNSYGHPAAQVLATLAGVDVYRTDLSGTLSCFSDGTAEWMSCSPDAGTAGDASESGGGSGDDGSSGTLPSPSTPSGPSDPDTSTTVMVTRTGEKYHYSWCPTIKRSKSLRSMSVADAKAKGYEACKVCKPPA